MIANRPGMTFKFTPDFDYDGCKPPTFILRYLSGIEFTEVLESSKVLDDMPDDAITEKMDVYINILKIGMVGWSGMVDTDDKPIEFKHSILGGTLAITEIRQTVAAIMMQIPSVDDKKKLNSQLPSSTENSVEQDAEGLRNAETSPAKPIQ